MDNQNTEYKSPSFGVMKTLQQYNPQDEELSLEMDKDYEPGLCRKLDEETDDSNTTLTLHLVVDGNVDAKDSVHLDGRINGNLKTSEDFSSTGVIVGDVGAYTAVYDNAKVFGNTDARGEVRVSNGTIVVGNIKAQDVTVNGKIKGAIEAVDTATFMKDAVVVADIKTGKINVDGQAKLNANITLVTENVTTVSDDEFKMDLGEK